MDCQIYLITDCDNKKYVGKTTQTLRERLSKHKYDKKNTIRKCSSRLLNLDDCKIELLEECNKEDSQERERYWINKIDSVNYLKLNFDKQVWKKEYEASEERKKYKYEWNKKNLIYQKSWGGDIRGIQNSLLKIDPTLFS